MKYIRILALCVAVAMLPSCSMVKDTVAKVMPPKSSSTGSKVSSGTVKTDKKGKAKGSTPASGSVRTAKGTAPTMEELTGGTWTISAVGNVTVEAEDDAPYMAFDAAGRFYASDGCNVTNGTYTLRSDGVMTFTNMISTANYCPELQYVPMIAQVLAEDARPVLDCKRIGQDTYLYFKDTRGKTLMTLRRHNMEFLNGNWAVTSIDGKAVEDDEMNVFFDVPELKIHGNTGCNYFNGVIYIDPMRSNAFDLSNMQVTRMSCPKTSRETAMLVALEQTATAIAGDGDDTVLLMDSRGHEVMTLRRIPLNVGER